jgi:hypothetical protein
VVNREDKSFVVYILARSKEHGARSKEQGARVDDGAL